MLRLSLFSVRCGVSESLMVHMVDVSPRAALCLPVGGACGWVVLTGQCDRCFRHCLRTHPPYSHHPLPGIPHFPPVSVPPLPRRGHNDILRHRLRVARHILPLRKSVVAVAACVQNRDAITALCVFCNTVPWE